MKPLPSDLGQIRPRGQFFQQMIGEFGGFRVVGFVVELLILPDRQLRVFFADIGIRLPEGDRAVGVGGGPAVRHLIQRFREPDFNGRNLRGAGIAVEELPAGGGHVGVSRSRFQPIDVLEHDLRVPFVRGVRTHKPLGDANQPEHPPVLMIEIAELDHHIGRRRDRCPYTCPVPLPAGTLLD